MLGRALLAAVLLPAVVASGEAGRTAPGDPFAFLDPGVQMSPAERGRLDAGATVVKVLPAGARELGVVAAVRTSATPERLIAWTREIAALRRSRYVPLVSRVSSPPRLEDFEALTLDVGDLDDVRRCRPGDCGLKLGAAEMERMQQAMRGRADWQEAGRQAFRRVALERVERYLAEGDDALPAYDDHATPVSPAAEVDALVEELGLASPHLPGVAAYVRGFPHITRTDVADSFVYWAVEAFGGKPIVSVSHVVLLQSDGTAGPAALTITKQLQRSHVDVLRGVFGGILRRMMEGRVRDEAPAVLSALRARIEEDDPP